MRVRFHQAVHLKGKTPKKGKDYSRGVHEVPEEHLADPHFHRLIKAGLVDDGEAPRGVAPASFQERQQRLADKLARSAKVPSPEQGASPVSSSDAPEAPSAEMPAGESEHKDPESKPEADDHAEGEDKESSKKKHKQKHR